MKHLILHNLKKAKLKKITAFVNLYLTFNLRDFLTGFRKRKQERRKKAREELDIQVKEERKKIKQEVCNVHFMTLFF